MEVKISGSNRLNYMPWLDVAKGIGIILVMINHAMFPNHLIIDGFHIALFFFLAGYTFSTRQPFFTFVKKKTLRILVPCILFASIWAITGIPNIPIWFLYTLFFSLIILYPLIKYLPLWSACFIMLVMSLLFSGKSSFIDLIDNNVVRVVLATTYVFVGYLVKCFVGSNHFKESRSKLLIDKTLKTRWKTIACAIIASGTYLAIVLGCQHWGFYSELSFGKLLSFKIIWGLSWLIPICGTISLILFAIVFQKIKLLQWFGKNSLVMMCVHFPVAEYLNQFISTLPNFGNMGTKLCYGMLEYMLIILWSCIMVWLCKRFIPTLTGSIK